MFPVKNSVFDEQLSKAAIATFPAERNWDTTRAKWALAVDGEEVLEDVMGMRYYVCDSYRCFLLQVAHIVPTPASRVHSAYRNSDLDFYVEDITHGAPMFK